MKKILIVLMFFVFSSGLSALTNMTGNKSTNVLGNSLRTLVTSVTSAIGVRITSLSNTFSEGSSCLTYLYDYVPDSFDGYTVSAGTCCDDSLRRIVIPETYNGVPVTKIYTSGFINCSISNIILPKNLRTIGLMAFQNTKLSKIVIPDGVSKISSSAFYSSTSLADVSMGEGVQTLGVGAFAGCTKLANIRLHNNIFLLETAAFQGCTALNYIEIPESVTTIDQDCFSGCSRLSNVIMKRFNPPLLSTGVFTGCPSGFKIWVPDSASAVLYKAAANWSTYAANIVSYASSIDIASVTNWTTGKISTSKPDYIITRMAGSWDYPATNPATLSTISGTNGTIDVYPFDDTLQEGVKTYFQSPPDLRISSTVKFNLIGFPSNATNGRYVRMKLMFSTTTNMLDWDKVWITNSTGNILTFQSNKRMNCFSWSNTTGGLGFYPNGFTRMRLYRIAPVSVSNLSGDFNFVNLRMRLQRQ